MEYITVKEAASKWGITERRISTLCVENRIEGALKFGWSWAIPITADKPDDARRKETDCAKDNVPAIPQSLRIERIWAMPNKNTFDIKPIHELIVSEMTDGKWIDPFANKNKLASITNDLNNIYDTDYHIDALDFLKLFDDSSVDGVLYDPPYSPRQVSECYNNVGYNVTWDTTKASFWSNHKREISRIVRIGGKVITFGWNSGGIGVKYGFRIERILLVPHGGWHNDTICTVEIKVNEHVCYDGKRNNGTVPTVSTNEGSSEIDNQLIAQIKKLPQGYWDFSQYDTHELTHGLHTYPAMMIYPISRSIISIVKNVMPITSLLDPFSGSGTVLVEGMLAGIDRVYGNDLNPFARFISEVKTKPIKSEDLLLAWQEVTIEIENEYSKHIDIIYGINDYFVDTMELDLAEMHGWGESASDYLNEYLFSNSVNVKIQSFKNLGYWFKPRVILELQMIKDAIFTIQDCTIRNFMLLTLSEVIRIVSNRRNGEFKMFRMTPDSVRKHDPDVKLEFYKMLDRNVKKMISFSDVILNSNTLVSIYADNAMSLDSILDNSVDLVITSPPYGDSRTTVAYGEFSRLSMQWLSLPAMSEKQIMGIDKSLMGGRKFRNGFDYMLSSSTLKVSLERIMSLDIERAGDVYSFYDDLDKAITTITKKTRTGGYQFWVVGNRTVKGELLKTDIILAELASAHGLKFVYSIDRNISNKVMPSRNSPTNVAGNTASTIVNEHIVVLRKI